MVKKTQYGGNDNDKSSKKEPRRLPPAKNVRVTEQRIETPPQQRALFPKKEPRRLPLAQKVQATEQRIETPPPQRALFPKKEPRRLPLAQKVQATEQRIETLPPQRALFPKKEPRRLPPAQTVQATEQRIETPPQQGTLFQENEPIRLQATEQRIETPPPQRALFPKKEPRRLQATEQRIETPPQQGTLFPKKEPRRLQATEQRIETPPQQGTLFQENEPIRLQATEQRIETPPQQGTLFQENEPRSQTHRRKENNISGINDQKFINDGTYGCVYNKPFDCIDNTTVEKSGNVGKIFKPDIECDSEGNCTDFALKTADTEYRIRNIIEKWDLSQAIIEAHFILPIQICDISANENKENIMKINTTTNNYCNITINDTENIKLKQIIYKNGGNNLLNVLIDNKIDNKIDIKTLQNIIKHIKNGINIIKQNRHAHCDIKLENIVYDGETARIIDFGLFTDNISTLSRKPYFIYPPILTILQNIDLILMGVFGFSIKSILLEWKQSFNDMEIYYFNDLDLNAYEFWIITTLFKSETNFMRLKKIITSVKKLSFDLNNTQEIEKKFYNIYDDILEKDTYINIYKNTIFKLIDDYSLGISIVHSLYKKGWNDFALQTLCDDLIDAALYPNISK